MVSKRGDKVDEILELNFTSQVFLVEALSTSISIVPNESAGKAVERLANKRRLRHQEALQACEESIAAIHQNLEERLFNLSNEFSINSEALDAELRRLLAVFGDDAFALACYRDEMTSESPSLEEKGQYAFPTNLTSLLNYLNRLNDNRAISLQRFEESLVAIEETRKTLVGEQLSMTAKDLMSIAYLLPEEIEMKFIGEDHLN